MQSRRSSRLRSPNRRGSCGPGYIRRRSYHRKSFINRRGVHVRATDVPQGCAKDLLRGQPPRPKVGLPKLTPGRLSKYGYRTSKAASGRHAALNAAIEAEGYATIIRRLVAVSNFNKRSQPSVHAIMREDIEWAKQKHAKRG